ncbi:SDR family NAD(P)-dependent oxidoreductase [Salinisphaera sp. Q1T1-3]|uniref:SDR family NAD(P)-dependent oxidoreductase n=1 Tax=Salinisphaera sp. Q1T1-3 TaxID=2321229 RepID=UPI000E758711|nr:SDR family oxidoreductase [Salinisphaera sp. Q1T1-3]RJS91490.1 SDR family oxidoreductase [Salinisphaera sp. Q1T1-3]
MSDTATGFDIREVFDLSGQTAVVTGGNQGIGRALCFALGQAGATVVIAARNAERNASVVAELEAAGHVARAITLDVTDYQSWQDGIAAIDAPIDILVNNAGICYHEPALDVAPARFADVMDLNVTGLWYGCQQVGAQMIDRGKGSIVNVGSMSGMIVNRPQMQPAYNASKAAVHHLTRSLAAEWAPYGVRVNAIAPGYVRTEMSPIDRPEFKRYWLDDAPMQRAAEPAELGPAVVYLSSRASGFVTGEVLTLDGGYTLF